MIAYKFSRIERLILLQSFDIAEATDKRPTAELTFLRIPSLSASSSQNPPGPGAPRIPRRSSLPLVKVTAREKIRAGAARVHAGACVPSQVFPPPPYNPRLHQRRRPPAPRPRQKINVPCNPCIMHSRFVLARPEPGENERTAPVKFTRAATRAHLNVVRPCALRRRERHRGGGARRRPAPSPRGVIEIPA